MPGLNSSYVATSSSKLEPASIVVYFSLDSELSSVYDSVVTIAESKSVNVLSIVLNRSVLTLDSMSVRILFSSSSVEE